MTEPYNAAERQHVKGAAKAEKASDAARREFLRAAMTTRQGRTWFWTELESFGVFTSSFSTDPLQMAFAEGRRSSGLRLLSDLLTFTPDEFVQMMRESNARSDAPAGTRSRPTEPESVSEPPAGSDPDAEPDSRTPEAGGWNLADHLTPQRAN